MRQGPKWERASISPPVGLASLWLIFYIEAPCLLFLTFSVSQDDCFPVELHWWKLGEIALCRRMFCPQCSPTRVSETILLLSLPWPPLAGNFFSVLFGNCRREGFIFLLNASVSGPVCIMFQLVKLQIQGTCQTFTHRRAGSNPNTTEMLRFQPTRTIPEVKTNKDTYKQTAVLVKGSIYSTQNSICHMGNPK